MLPSSRIRRRSKARVGPVLDPWAPFHRVPSCRPCSSSGTCPICRRLRRTSHHVAIQSRLMTDPTRPQRRRSRQPRIRVRRRCPPTPPSDRANLAARIFLRRAVVRQCWTYQFRIQMHHPWLNDAAHIPLAVGSIGPRNAALPPAFWSRSATLPLLPLYPWGHKSGATVRSCRQS
jgi:hypothetical protein